MVFMREDGECILEPGLSAGTLQRKLVDRKRPADSWRLDDGDVRLEFM